MLPSAVYTAPAHPLPPAVCSDGAAVVTHWRAPFATGAGKVELWMPGVSVADIVAGMNGLPADFSLRGVVRINDEEVPRGLWASVRPKPQSRQKPVVVSFHMPLGAGGGDGGGGDAAAKGVMAIVAALALTFLTAGIGAGLLGPAGSLSLGSSFFAAGSMSAKVLAATVGIAGALAISALTAPPAVKPSSSANANQDTPEAASAEGNILELNGPVPRVIGTRKVYPALAGDAIVELVGQDECVEAAYILAGPHELTDIRIGDAAIGDASDLSFETREGWPDDSRVTLLTRQGRTLSLNIETSAHDVSNEAQTNLKNTVRPDLSLPVWHAAASRRSPDEIWLHFLLPEGLRITDNPNVQMIIPLRVRIRRKGDPDWINLPELHYSSNAATQTRCAILLKWADPPSAIPGAPTKNGFVAAWKTVPGQTIAPPAPGWTAHSHFSSGSGDDILYAGVEGATKVARTAIYDNRAEFFLDPGIIPPGVYDIEVKRGHAILATELLRPAYTIASVVYDLFGYYTSAGVARINRSRDKLAERLYFTRVISVWNEHPLPKPGFAIIAVKARNRRVERVSAVASGYVRDWDGTGWNTWTKTSNPAPHYRDTLVGRLNFDPLPLSLVDDDGLLVWRQACIDSNYRCDYIAEGGRLEETQRILAACGYARPYQSDRYGVVRDYDRTGEPMVQVFTPRNMKDFRIGKAFPRLPDGFRVTYRNDESDYSNDQAIVYRRGYDVRSTARLEQVSYDGLVNEADAIARADFDLRQAELRSAFYSFEAPVESICCRRGSLIGVTHDILTRQHGAGRIVSRMLDSSGDIIGVSLDSDAPYSVGGDMRTLPDMLDVDDLRLLGFPLAAAIRRSNGSISYHALQASGQPRFIRFASPLPDDVWTVPGEGDVPEVEDGCLVAVGEAGTETLSLIVTNIEPGRDLTAIITAVDEAPELHLS